ncbi:MAG: 3'-5' exonuclease [Gammaproteobacteria bacterium]|nr:3'-5' exonuclease [Gammaproteobacteria bacterium]
MELFFDTETSDKFNFKTQRYTDLNFPWIVQLGMILAENEIPYVELNLIIQPEGRTISEGAAQVHNISVELAERVGVWESEVLSLVKKLIKHADLLIAHNYEFDSNLLASMFHKNGDKETAKHIKYDADFYCTMQRTTNLCRLPGSYGFKWPKLVELHQFLFNEGFVGAHDAMYDIKATMKCYYELKKRGLIK